MRGFIFAFCIGTMTALGCTVPTSMETDAVSPTHQAPVDDFYPQKPSKDPNPCDQPTISYVTVENKTWAVEIPTLCTYEFPWDQGDPPTELDFQNEMEVVRAYYE